MVFVNIPESQKLDSMGPAESGLREVVLWEALWSVERVAQALVSLSTVMRLLFESWVVSDDAWLIFLTEDREDGVLEFFLQALHAHIDCTSPGQYSL